MPSELLILAAFLTALIVVLLATPAAIWLAGVTGFLDRPHTYKGHADATPYLGGLALMTAMLAGVLAAHAAGASLPGGITVGALCLLAVGTLDDKVNLGPWIRIVLTSTVAIALWTIGGGWNGLGAPGIDLAITIFWVVGVVNAFNLMDNMDGASGSVGAASAVGVGSLAAVWGDYAVAASAFALAGACVGFLRFNLAGSRARIFLGDGGSMPLGYMVAALVMALSHSGSATGPWFVLAAVPLVGAAALDTALVMVSRHRRGAPLWSGGRDHLTHRLRERLGGRRRVGAALAIGQLLLSMAGIALAGAGALAIFLGSLVYLGLSVMLIRILDSPSWRTSWIHAAERAALEAARDERADQRQVAHVGGVAGAGASR